MQIKKTVTLSQFLLFHSSFNYIFLSEAVNKYFLPNFKKNCCSFADNISFEKSKIVVKMASTCPETAVAIATVLNLKLDCHYEK